MKEHREVERSRLRGLAQAYHACALQRWTRRRRWAAWLTVLFAAVAWHTSHGQLPTSTITASGFALVFLILFLDAADHVREIRNRPTLWDNNADGQ